MVIAQDGLMQCEAMQDDRHEYAETLGPTDMRDGAAGQKRVPEYDRQNGVGQCGQ